MLEQMVNSPKVNGGEEAMNRLLDSISNTSECSGDCVGGAFAVDAGVLVDCNCHRIFPKTFDSVFLEVGS